MTHSNVLNEAQARPWFSADCDRAKAPKQSAYQAWADARLRKGPNTQNLKKTFNRVAVKCKRVLRRVKSDHVHRMLLAELVSFSAGSKSS